VRVVSTRCVAGQESRARFAHCDRDHFRPGAL